MRIGTRKFEASQMLSLFATHSLLMTNGMNRCVHLTYIRFLFIQPLINYEKNHNNFKKTLYMY